MNKKTFSILGIITGILAVLLGVLVLSGNFGGDTSTAGTAYPYDSGYTVFGADFYTYVSNNAGEAASAGRTAARNLHEIAHLLKLSLGSLFIIFGLFDVCLFGCKLTDSREPKPEALKVEASFAPQAPSSAPAETPAEDTPEGSVVSEATGETV